LIRFERIRSNRVPTPDPRERILAAIENVHNDRLAKVLSVCSECLVVAKTDDAANDCWAKAQRGIQRATEIRDQMIQRFAGQQPPGGPVA
jgi:hypothetical protein